MTHFRPFRNGDPPALAQLWNRGLPEQGVVRPLTGHDFDARVADKPFFEADGLIVATRDDHIVGFAHAGFGPDDPLDPSHRLNDELGTIAMMVVEPGPVDPELERGLIDRAERYLRSRGASVLYAGGQSPLNPFYWGLYGGSEFAGILASHTSFHRAVVAAGYEPASTTELLEADMMGPEFRDPRALLLRRIARLEVTEDVLPVHWWESYAIGEFRPTSYSLRSKADDRELAHATTWDMNWLSRGDDRARLGLINLDVHPEFRRKGFGRHLVSEMLRAARAESTATVAVQTRSTNLPALAFYKSLGFARVETATLYRLPAGLASRSL